jgi:hypothetical protein
MGSQSVFELSEMVSEADESRIDASADPMKEARNQRKKNKMAANAIGNRSAMGSQEF